MAKFSLSCNAGDINYTQVKTQYSSISITDDISLVYEFNKYKYDNVMLFSQINDIRKELLRLHYRKYTNYVSYQFDIGKFGLNFVIVDGIDYTKDINIIIKPEKFTTTVDLVKCLTLIKQNLMSNTYSFPDGPSWQNVGQAGFSAGEVLYTSLVVDGNNTTYIAYQDKANGDGISVEGFIGGQWDYISSAGFITPVTFTTLAIDKNNLKYVAFSDTSTTQAGKLTIMKYIDATEQWGFVGARGFSTAALTEPASLAISNTLFPHIAYKDSDGKAIVKKYNNTDWENVGATTSAGAATYVKLAISSDNTLYIAYADGANNNKITVLKFNGTSWTPVGSAGFSSGEAKHIALRLDKNNVPYVAFRDEAYAGRVTVMKFNGTAWVVVGTAGFGADGIDYLDLIIDSNGVPYVGFNDLAYINLLTVMKFDGTAWVVVGQGGFSAGQPTNLSMSIDNNDVPYCGYRDFGTDKKATVMKYD